jgi:hypothetical protein
LVSQSPFFAAFCDDLGLESAVFLDSSSGGSFAHLTLSDCKDILTKILQNTPYTGVYDEIPDEEDITQKEHMPNTLSEPKPIEEEPTFPTIQSVEVCTRLKKHGSPTNHFNHIECFDDPSCDFVYEFDDDLFADFGNTWNYHRVERPKAQEEPKLPSLTQRNEPSILGSLQIFRPS